MAKILAKNHSNHTKLVKLRQSYDWTVEELHALDEKYESKKQQEELRKPSSVINAKK